MEQTELSNILVKKNVLNEKCIAFNITFISKSDGDIKRRCII